MSIPTINFRILLLAVLPCTIVSIIFFGYFVKKQIDNIETHFVDKGESLAVHLATASEYGVFSGNMNILAPLLETSFIKNDVITISITNNRGIPLIQKTRGNNNPLLSAEPEDVHKHIFSQPIIQHTVDINDFENIDNNIPPVIGWVIIELSDEITQQQKQDTIFQALLTTLLILISSIFLTTRVSRHITKTISALNNAVKNDNLGVTVKAHETGALPTLEKETDGKPIESSHQTTQNALEQAVKKQKPLNSALGFVTPSKNIQSTQQQTHHLHTIKPSTKNLLNITNNVLDFSENGIEEIPVHNAHFNLAKCIEDVLILIAPAAYEKTIEISSLYYDDTPRELFGSVNHIQKILINLIGDVIKSYEQGTITVRTMLESQKKSAAHIKISISHQGSGSSKKEKTTPFSISSQIKNEGIHHQHSKNGLKLTTYQSFIEAIHGKISIENTENKDFTVCFTFQCQSNNTLKPTNKNDPLPYTNKSITLYDANELTRTSLIHTFRHLGFEVMECSDIETLYTSAKASNMPDICVLSINAREANATTTQQFLKTHRNNTHSKILAIVSHSDPLILKTLRDWGADACLSKPFRQTDFEKKLAAIFRDPKNIYHPTTKTTHAPTTFTRLDGLSILVAEDNAINATLTKTILHRAGAILHIVDNGQKAVSAFNNDQFDIILMDIHMPEMNGVDATRKIRETETSSTRIAIIGLTAASQSKNGPLSQNPDFDEILEKPIAVNTLLNAISYWAQIRQSPGKKNQTSPNTTNKLGIDTGLSLTLNEMLLQELPGVTEKLQTAYHSANHNILRSETHRLLGGLAYCNFTELHQLTLQFQTSLKANKDSMDEDFQAMLTEIKHVTSTKNI